MGNVCVFISSFALAGLNFVLPFFLQGVLAYSPSEMGIRLMTQPIVQAVVGPLSGWLADRLEARLLTSVGLVVASLGILLLSGLSPAATDPAVVLRLVVLGVGFGLFQTANNYAVMGSVKRAHRHRRRVPGHDAPPGHHHGRSQHRRHLRRPERLPRRGGRNGRAHRWFPQCVVGRGGHLLL
jgi:MFS family permease